MAVAAGSSVQESVRIYTVLDAQALLSARDRLAVVFAGRPEDADVTFVLSKDAGRIWFSDNRIIWKTKDPYDLPPTSNDADIAARAFIGRVNSAVQRDKQLLAAGISRLFPDDCRPALNGAAQPQAGVGSTQNVLVRNPDNGSADHWLVRYEAYLPTGTSADSVPVFGATVDIRVGPRGTVGACWVSWRPCLAQGVTPLIPFVPPDPNDSAADSASTAGESSADGGPVLVYFLADEGTTQPYLAPYYFLPQDDDGFYAPASIYSMTAELADDSTEQTARVAAAVNGGSGQYLYRWAAWDYANLEAGMVDLGTDDRIVLASGCYNVSLRVTDAVTGMTIFAERSIYTDMLGASETSP